MAQNGLVKEVGTQNFAGEVEQVKEPVVVDFTASWCPPCKMLAPVLESVAQKFDGKVKVVKCDIDAHQEVAARYGVQKIPNLLFFKSGQVVNQTVGYLNETQLSEKFNELLTS